MRPEERPAPKLPPAQAADGEQALRLLDRHAYAAVLMDVQMPVMDGLEFPSALVDTNPRKT
ncbi:response regulator [Solidesulfovibrio alcoholivorans]|uniref:response regulator n=1 Tax=Solidesulfovibrio alcoholivorans TaxID=81406 RepID=UPI00049795A0|nr:response regulator [Solidesulfovibrio alcoholivorans]